MLSIMKTAHGHSSHQSGFTLTELIVMVAIIALLGIFTVASLFSARDKAEAAEVMQQFSEIETAVIAHAVKTRRALPTSNHPVEDMVNGSVSAFPGFANYMNAYPEPPTGGGYSYVGDGPQPANCTDYNSGILIRLGQLSGAPALKADLLDTIHGHLETQLDDTDNDTCGRVRRAGNAIYYKIADSPNDVF